MSLYSQMNSMIKLFCCVALYALCSFALMADTPSYLPVVEQEGVKCYYYSAEKGETVYGITNKFGWDMELFMQYNPGAVDLKSGMVVYYPCEPDTSVLQDKKSDIAQTSDSKQVDTEKAVQSAPAEPTVHYTDISALSQEGVRNMASADIKPEFYTVKKGENLVNVAKNAQMSLYQLFKANPGLMPDNLEAGDKLLIYPGQNMSKARLGEVTEKKITGYKKHKIKQKDTWYSIARKNHLDTAMLMAANPNVKMLKKGEKILIPQLKDTLVSKWMPVVDIRENNAEGINQIYDEAHRSILSVESSVKPEVEIAILVSCDDTNSRRRDLEFLKGFMLGLKGHSYPDLKINLKGLDLVDYGNLERAISSGQLENSDIVICAVDKNFPDALIDYCSKQDKILINVFDAKTDLASLLPSGIQLLPPSEYFYDRTSDFLTRVMNDRTFIFVGNRDGDVESISAAVLERLKDNGHNDIIMLDNSADLSTYPFNPAHSYVVISDAGKKDEIMSTLKNLESVVDKYPNMPLSIVGRPNWMVYSSSLESLFRKLDTYVPSRFVIDDDSSEAKAFNAEFKSYYDSMPLKSLPMYSAMGYDVANYFPVQYVNTKGDLNLATPADKALQLEFRLGRNEKYEGLMNRRVYLLHFTPFSTTEKISL